MMRVVIDTNMLVSFLFWDNEVLNNTLEQCFRHAEVLCSEETLSELTDVIFRKKFDRYLSKDTRNDFLGYYEKVAIRIMVDKDVTGCRDRKDDKFLSLAVCGNADLIITNDKDLLVLNPFRGIRILKVVDVARMIGN